MPIPLIRNFLLFALILTVFNLPVTAQTTTKVQIEIRLAAGNESEKQTEIQLNRILKNWDLAKWTFTKTVLIDSGVIPHSHPILTLNTSTPANDTVKLKSFVHEQLHWFLSRYHAAADSAIDDLTRVFPDAPGETPDERNSNYLHLLVGVLEFDALDELFGEKTATRLIARTPFYTWVYRKVLDHQELIRGILKKYIPMRPDARN
jgi:hypothetical protein